MEFIQNRCDYSRIKPTITDYLELELRHLQFLKSSTYIDIFYMPPLLQIPGLEAVKAKLRKS